MTTEERQISDAVSDDGDKTLSSQLLHFQDDLNNMLSAMAFYREAIMALIENAECSILDSQRQRNGLALTGRWILETGQSLSERMTAIREDIKEDQPDNTNPDL